jgi:metallophosphoesterase superfamily enzyme
LSGHIHPVVRLRGLMKRAMRVPVFWQRATSLVLPAFGLFTGGFAVRPAPGDCLYAAGPSGVVSLGGDS